MAVVPGTNGPEALYGGVGDDVINALDGNDTLDGGSGGIDTLNGGNGDDILYTRSDDEAYGGSGNDIIAISGDQPAVLDGGAGANDILRFEGAFDISGITLTGIEQLNAYGNGRLTATQLGSFGLVSGYGSGNTNAQLTLTEGGTAAVNLSASLSDYFYITGSAQADILSFNVGYTGIIYAYAGYGNDNITAAAGNDSLRGDDGKDTLSGLDGNDSMDGGNGADQLAGGNGNDTMIGGTGDSMNGGAGDDLISITSDLPSALVGGANVDVLRFEGGYDITGATLSGIEQALLTGNVQMTLAQLGSFNLVSGYSTGNTTAQVSLTQGGTATVRLSGTLTAYFTLYGSSGADNVTFAPAYGATVYAYVGAGDDVVNGASGADSIRGENGSDTLNGLNGNDSIDGGAGLDAIYGGNNDDFLIAGLGDSIFGGANNDFITVSESLPAELNGGAGQDTLRFDAGFDITGATITGIEQLNVNGTSTMTATQLGGFSKVSGYGPGYTSGQIYLTEGGTAAISLDTALTAGFFLQGSAQADLLTFAPGYASIITVQAGQGNDSITSASGADSLRGDDGNDTLNGLNGNDSLDGGSGIDAIYGGGNNDYLVVRAQDSAYGGANDDMISVQGNGPAVLDGGAGFDILRFESGYDITGSTVTLIEQANLNGTVYMTAAQLNGFTKISGYGPGYTSATLALTQGGTAAVTLDTSMSVSFTLYGSATADIITFAPAGLQQLFVYAGNGNDSITGAGGNDSMQGNNGNDTLLGLNGNDSLDGGLGSDSLDGGNGDDYLITGLGDRASGGGNNDLISVTQSGVTAVNGGSGTDILRLESGYDLTGTTITLVEQLNLNGTVLLTAAQLNSFATVAGYSAGYTSASVALTVGGTATVKLSSTLSAGFTLTGSAQDDNIKFTAAYLGPLTIWAGNGDDSMTGAAGNDYLRGEYGNDTLTGLNGNDTFEGGAGADILNGGTGIDSYYGGSGRDTFAFSLTSSSDPSTPDRINDFEAAGAGKGDLIDVSVIDADGGLGANDSFAFGSNGLRGLSVVDSGTDTLVRLNTDNDAAFEAVILIVDGAVLASDYTAADFVL